MRIHFLRSGGALLLAPLLAISACTQQSPPQPLPPAAATPSIDEYKREVAYLESEIKSLKGMELQTSSSMWTLMGRMPPKVATFDPQAAPSYARVEAPIGVVLIRLLKVEPYLDGFTATFMIGNPSTLALTGIEGEVRWSRQWDPQKPEADISQKSQSFKMTNVFPAGIWSPVKINFAPAKAEEIRNISIQPTFDYVATIDAQ